MSCVVCGSYAVEHEPAYGCASCAVQREAHAIQHTTHIDSVRLTHYTAHDAHP